MDEGMLMKVFVVHSMGMSKDALRYAKGLEDDGHDTYVPCRDTVQVPPDKTEEDLKLNWEREILAQNLKGVIWCDEAHCIWDLSSLGTIFDLGCAYALGKPIFIVKTKTHHWTKFIIKKEGNRLI